MANSVTVEVKGLRELGLAMRELTEKVNKQVVRKAASAGAALVRDQVRANVYTRGLVKRTGLLGKAVGMRYLRKASRPGYAVYAVGIFKVPGGTYANTKRNRRLNRVGKKYEVEGTAYYWRFHELGTVRESPKPFLVPAYTSRKMNAVEKIKDEARKGITRAAAKAAK